ncbi:MAG TPA: hypothetical protein VGM88_17040 [Kofleriaceae bacterium]|jgi:tRNA nucleotidyltransferase (CCA-adding enzyme)
MTDALARLAAAVPPNVRAVCATLAAAGYQAVTVGGAVRDALLGRDPGDWDVATSATPDEVMALFPRSIPTGIQHGTVTVVTGKGEASHVEVTTFRGEGAYTDARRPDHVTFGVPLVEDLARRDLRVNAMAYDPAAGVLVDPYGGQQDLADRMLRAVGPTGDAYVDGVARFTEDGLRVMRAVRFAAALEFELDPATERALSEPGVLASLDKVSRERVSDELRKTLAARHPSRALAIAERTGVLAHVLPALGAGLDAWLAYAEAGLAVRVARGDFVHRWLSRVDAAAPDARLGALVGDLATPGWRLKRLDRDTVARVTSILKALKFSNDESASAGLLAGLSFAPLLRAWTPAEVRRVLADAGRASAPLALSYWRACLASAITEIDVGAEQLVDAAAGVLSRAEPIAPKDLAIAGKDLVELGMEPGPKLGVILGLLFDRVLEDPSRNTRETLLSLSRQLALEVAVG